MSIEATTPEPAPGIALVTDSTHCLTPAMLARSKASVVDLYVGWESELRPEPSFTNAEFYERLRASDSLPTTSQPSVGDFVEVYEPLVAAGRDVVSIHIAGGVSGTCAAANEAARSLAEGPGRGRVEVFDARTGAGALGCLVMVAADAIAKGATVEQIVRTTRAAQESLDFWFCLDTLEYLRRGGRIGAAQAAIGTALRVKPILTFASEITPVGRVRSRKRAFDRMVEYLRELKERGATEWIVQHAQAPGDAERLVAQGELVFDKAPFMCTEVSPVLGAHLGSGMLVGGFRWPGLDPGD